jgi:hypothetical protein
MNTLKNEAIMKHILIYLSLHHLFDAVETDIANNSLNENEWVPLFAEYYYEMSGNTILRRLKASEAESAKAKAKNEVEVVNVMKLLDDVAVGVREIPHVSPSFSF